MTARFNPFPHVKATYGAPMGRRGDTFANYTGGKLCAKHCGGDGYYDRGGAYWGHSRVYAVWAQGKGDDWCVYVNADSRQDAIAKVKAEI